MAVIAAPRAGICLLLSALCVLPAGRADDAKPKADAKAKEIAGTSEFLRSVPKHFAVLKAVNAARRQVTLLIDGESLPKVWQLTPDAEVKLAGWWARLDQLTVGDRVWCWFETNRAKEPVAVFMLCDELSEQDMHGPGLKLEARAGKSITVKDAKGKARTLPADGAEVRQGPKPASLDDLVPEASIYIQTAAAGARLILDAAAFELRRAVQKAALRQRWLDQGLPGTVLFLHRLTGELELMLDHETMRWARALQPGDKVSLPAEPPIAGVVRHVRPWRERTQVRLVVATFDQADLAVGRRVALKAPAPAAEVEASPLPPDVDRPRATKEERVDWFLASIYCTCKVGGDGCTGHFYTLASCNPNACGMPNAMRRLLAERIDKGMSDREIFEGLIKERGPDLLRPHLLP